jgi:4-hydroxy-3-polyprenylbenzoate decarboxylase
MKTVAGIAHGYSQNLLLRAADVAIKERRKLVLVARESPLSSVHLTNLLILANAGVIILPPVLTYYHRPATIQDMTAHIVGKILDAFGIEFEGFRRWDPSPANLPPHS